MGLFRRKPPAENRDILPYSFDEWIADLQQWGLWNGSMSGTLTGTEETIAPGFDSYVSQAYKANGVVFSCMLARQMLFSEARFTFRELVGGRPGKLGMAGDNRNAGVRDLAVLANPWPNGTTGDLLTRAIQDADLAGNFFAVRRGSRLFRLRPDWVTIVLGSDGREYDAEPVGYLYHPGGRASGMEPDTFTVEQVAHFAPIPDPVASYRGMSWLTPVIREISADGAATSHKKKFFENGATVNLIVKTGIPDTVPDRFQKWIELFRDKHAGAANAYKTLFLASGQDATPVGANLLQADFKQVQGSGETRIAAAAGMHPVIVGLSEGLQGSSLNTGNFQAARRLTSDKTLRPLWRNVAGSFAKLVAVPAGFELWYDDRDIPFLREDAKDAAETRQTEASTLKNLIEAGFEAQSAVGAVISGDFSGLEHTGLFSVQLQAPGSTKMPTGEAPGEKPVADGTKPVTGKPPAKKTPPAGGSN